MRKRILLNRKGIAWIFPRKVNEAIINNNTNKVTIVATINGPKSFSMNIFAGDECLSGGNWATNFFFKWPISHGRRFVQAVSPFSLSLSRILP
jgi:hypothetical protein